MAAEHEIVLAGADESAARAAADAAIADVARIEAKYSRYRDDSVTSRINRAAGGAAVPIDEETSALLDYAARCHALSEGRFDITSGVLRRAWDFKSPAPRVPTATELATLLELVGWTNVERDVRTVRLARPGMEIDFGGIGKEYAADRAATILHERGMRHGFVNLAGDLRAIGPQPDGAPWRVGIRHPRAAGAVAGIDLLEGALATSGDYERCFDLEGKRYCHILDATTGMPVAHWQSVSVMSSLCVVAGTCATIAMLLQDEAPVFLEAQGVRWLGVAADGSLCGLP